MGAKQHTYATIRTALDLIADRRIAATHVRSNADGLRAKILTDLRAKLHDEALAIVEGESDITAAALAAELDASSKPRPDEAPNPSSAIPDFTAEPWTPLDPETRQQARERIAAIRETIADTTKAEAQT